MTFGCVVMPYLRLLYAQNLLDDRWLTGRHGCHYIFITRSVSPGNKVRSRLVYISIPAATLSNAQPIMSFLGIALRSHYFRSSKFNDMSSIQRPDTDANGSQNL